MNDCLSVASLPLCSTAQTVEQSGFWAWLTSGTPPQYGLFFLALYGLWFTCQQLKQNRKDRRAHDLQSILDSTIAHNAHFLDKPAAKEAIKTMEGLNVPETDEEMEVYWATRGVHLNHLNLVWRIWELAGQPPPGKPMPSEYDGWERFAREIVSKNLRAAAQAVEDDKTTPENCAGYDLWTGLAEYEVLPTRFVDWLQHLSKPRP